MDVHFVTLGFPFICQRRSLRNGHKSGKLRFFFFDLDKYSFNEGVILFIHPDLSVKLYHDLYLPFKAYWSRDAPTV